MGAKLEYLISKSNFLSLAEDFYTILKNNKRIKLISYKVNKVTPNKSIYDDYMPGNTVDFNIEIQFGNSSLEQYYARLCKMFLRKQYIKIFSNSEENIVKTEQDAASHISFDYDNKINIQIFSAKEKSTSFLYIIKNLDKLLFSYLRQLKIHETDKHIEHYKDKAENIVKNIKPVISVPHFYPFYDNPLSKPAIRLAPTLLIKVREAEKDGNPFIVVESKLRLSLNISFRNLRKYIFEHIDSSAGASFVWNMIKNTDYGKMLTEKPNIHNLRNKLYISNISGSKIAFSNKKGILSCDYIINLSGTELRYKTSEEIKKIIKSDLNTLAQYIYNAGVLEFMGESYANQAGIGMFQVYRKHVEQFLQQYKENQKEIEK